MMEPFGGRTPLGGRMKQLFGAVVWNCENKCHKNLIKLLITTDASAYQLKQEGK